MDVIHRGLLTHVRRTPYQTQSALCGDWRIGDTYVLPDGWPALLTDTARWIPCPQCKAMMAAQTR